MSLFDADRFELEFVFLDRLHDPTLDRVFAVQRFILVAHDGVLGEASEDGFHVVRIAGIDVLLNAGRQFDRHNLRKSSAI